MSLSHGGPDHAFVVVVVVVKTLPGGGAGGRGGAGQPAHVDSHGFVVQRECGVVQPWGGGVVAAVGSGQVRLELTVQVVASARHGWRVGGWVGRSV